MRGVAMAAVAAVIFGTACLPSRAAEPVHLSPDGRRLECAGREFRPWGFNYDRDYKFRLIEEYWNTEWETVVGDFREMKALGANAVRVHLQLAEFMDAPDRGNEKNLARLRDLLKLAQDTGLYLDLTGLACYRQARVPAWYANASEADRWRAQANFWRTIAATCRDSDRVLCYDLINEPLVPAAPRKPGDFLTGKLADFTYCQFITLDPAGRPRDQVARDWAHAMVAAIREVDPNHLVTIGMLPNSISLDAGQSGFLPATLAKELDYLSVHIYPSSKPEQARIDAETLATFARAGKPVVIEETFPLNCGRKEFHDFLHRSRTQAVGVFGFYWGQTVEEMDLKHSIRDAMMADWYELFRSAKADWEAPAK